jgi:hypothetical protein
MKRLFFVSLATCLIGLSSFASEKNVPLVLKTFYKTFKNAQNVNWTEVDDMLRIGFILNGHSQYAYYSNDELVVVATEIKADQLPETLKAQLAEYKGSVTQVYEMNKNNVKEYCVVLDTPSKHIVLKGKNKWKMYLEEKK